MLPTAIGCYFQMAREYGDIATQRPNKWLFGRTAAGATLLTNAHEELPPVRLYVSHLSLFRLGSLKYAHGFV